VAYYPARGGKSMESYATVKGQIVIPAELRKKYGIKAGTKIEIVDEGERIVLQPITREYIRGLRGKYKGKGLMKALVAEKKREREL
jgi:AbrB family looped-hinge helix DNA binding protein